MEVEDSKKIKSWRKIQKYLKENYGVSPVFTTFLKWVSDYGFPMVRIHNTLYSSPEQIDKWMKEVFNPQIPIFKYIKKTPKPIKRRKRARPKGVTKEEIELLTQKLNKIHKWENTKSLKAIVTQGTVLISSGFTVAETIKIISKITKSTFFEIKVLRSKLKTWKKWED